MFFRVCYNPRFSSDFSVGCEFPKKAARSAVADLQVVLLGRSPGDHCRVGSSAVGALSALGKVQEDQ